MHIFYSYLAWGLLTLHRFWDINYIDYYQKSVEGDPPVFPNQTSTSTTAATFPNTHRKYHGTTRKRISANTG